MKKILLIVLLLAFFAMFAMPVYAAQRVVLQNGSDQEVGQALKPHSIAQGTADTLVKTGAATVYMVTVTGHNMNPADRVNIYDGTSATGSPKLDVEVGVNNPIEIPGGVTFSTGIYVDGTGLSSGDGTNTGDGWTIVYD